jgi:hypothetical protein
VDSTLEEGLTVEPTIVDSDGDHVADADELTLYGTDPTLADTDADGLSDGEELFGSQTNPLLWEEFSGAKVSENAADTGMLAPKVADTSLGTETDLDADNYPDAAELEMGLDPGNPDTDGDAVADGDELNIYGTDPTLFDTDGDGLSDGEELFATATDPLIADRTGAGP